MAEPNAENQAALQLRLTVDRGVIQNFEINPELKDSSRAACSTRFFTSSNICVDIENNPATKSITKGMLLGTLTVKWDSQQPGNLTKELDNSRLITYATAPTAIVNTTNYSTYLFPALITLSVISLAIVTLLYLPHFKLFNLSGQKQFAFRTAMISLAVLLLAGSVISAFYKPIDNYTAETPGLDLLPMTGSSKGTITRKVWVISYNPILNNGKRLSDSFNYNNPASMPQGISDWFKTTSADSSVNFNIDFKIINFTELNEFPRKLDGFTYTSSTYETCMRDHATCHMPEMIDYLKNT